MGLPLPLALRIWFRAVLLNSLLFFIVTFFLFGLAAIFVAVVTLFLGLLTVPYFILVAILLQMASRLPYTNKARIVWLGVMSAVISSSFYVVVYNIFEPGDEVAWWTAITAIAVISSVVLNTKKILLFFQLEQEYRESIVLMVRNPHPSQNEAPVSL